MELETCVRTMAILVVLVFGGVVPDGHISEDDSSQSKLLQRMDHIQRQMSDVARSIAVLDRDIGKMIVRCLSKDDHLCQTSNDELQTTDDKGLIWSQVKRSGTETPPMANNRMYKELYRKRAMVNHLMETVQAAGRTLSNERKRSCNLNLGFHCDTQEISDFADVYDFLSSANSPGKKRSFRSVS